MCAITSTWAGIAAIIPETGTVPLTREPTRAPKLTLSPVPTPAPQAASKLQTTAAPPAAAASADGVLLALIHASFGWLTLRKSLLTPAKWYSLPYILSTI